MIRPIPNLNNAYVVKYPSIRAKIDFTVVLIFNLMDILFWYLALQQGLPQSEWTMSQIFKLILFIIWTIALFVAQIIVTKNLFKPPIILIANKEGIYLNILVKSNNLFFINWNQIVDIGINEVNSPYLEKKPTSIEGLTLALKPDKYNMPKVFQATVVDYTDVSISLSLSVIKDGETVLKRLKELKQEHS